MRNIINLNAVAEGALLEKANQAMQKIIENIMDPNTDATKTRKLTMTVTLKPNENRDLAPAVIDVKTTLAPTKGVNTNFILGEDSAGATGAEMKSGIPGQMFIDKEGDIANDRGVKLDELEKREQDKQIQEEKIVKFK